MIRPPEPGALTVTRASIWPRGRGRGRAACPWGAPGRRTLQRRPAPTSESSALRAPPTAGIPLRQDRQPSRISARCRDIYRRYSCAAVSWVNRRSTGGPHRWHSAAPDGNAFAKQQSLFSTPGTGLSTPSETPWGVLPLPCLLRVRSAASAQSNDAAVPGRVPITGCSRPRRPPAAESAPGARSPRPDAPLAGPRPGGHPLGGGREQNPLAGQAGRGSWTAGCPAARALQHSTSRGRAGARPV
jgi:hypothetical protein